MYIFFLEVLIALLLFPEQLMTLNKCKKTLYNTGYVSIYKL